MNCSVKEIFKDLADPVVIILLFTYTKIILAIGYLLNVCVCVCVRACVCEVCVCVHARLCLS